MFTFSKVNGWMVGLAVMVGIVAIWRGQVLANHPAEAWIRINYVKIKKDTDNGAFNGCSDPRLYIRLRSASGQERNSLGELSRENVCPGKRIWQNYTLQMASANNPISSGFMQVTWMIEDDDSPFAGEVMNNGVKSKIPCDGQEHGIYKSTPSSIFSLAVRCNLLAAPGPQADLTSLTTQLDFAASNDVVTQLQIFDAVGRKVAELTGTSEEAMSLMAKAQRPLANGVYLAMITRRAPDGRLITNEVRKLIVVR
jgi:hypothetical protein